MVSKRKSLSGQTDGADSSSVASTSKARPSSASTTSGTVHRQVGMFRTLQIGSHWCYMRQNQGGAEDDERTLFMLNLPIDTTERHLRTLFAAAGQAESVRLWKGKAAMLRDEEVEREEQGQRSGSKAKEAAPQVVPLPSLDPRNPHAFLPTSTSAHITFLDRSSLERALDMQQVKSWPDPFRGVTEARARREEQAVEEEDESATKKRRGRPSRTAEEALLSSRDAHVPPTGLDFLLARHAALRPADDAIRRHVDSVIAHFEYRLKNPLPKPGQQSGIEAVSVGPNGELLDADGFTIVQPTGKYGRTADGQGGSVRVARARGQGQSRTRGADGDAAGTNGKKRRLELDDFYRFQRREAKRQELADLRAKFQADQEKVKELKAKRNFKPF